ncbi:TRAP transporter small permease [Roseibium aggregatum]|uniref:TRAP transporter small permease protein n=1 Tax=Roseibium aggregatum TaxID=187304 RepID=A0A939J5Q3_9HYPH|nr:TRAP transporter small permease [Roseibium aggregatum]MBN9671969.1 TRAP transporter small permease [Roseibium aggregatum]
MKAVRNLLDLSELALAVVCVIAFVAMFVLGIATVVFRYVIESSLAFPDELIRYLFIWMIFLGSAIAFRRNMHAAIGILVAHLPPVLKRSALILATLACVLFFAVLFRSGLLLTLRVQAQISPALEVSMAWVYGAIPAGMAFLLIYAAELLARQWRLPADQLLADDH